jgi:hypothetical protein
MDMDLTQLWYELKLEMEQSDMTLIVDMMSNMEARMKDGPEYK